MRETQLTWEPWLTGGKEVRACGRGGNSGEAVSERKRAFGGGEQNSTLKKAARE